MKYFLLLLLFFANSSFGDLSPPFHLSYHGAGVGSIAEDFSQLLNPATLGFHRRSKSAVAYSVKRKEQMLSLVFTDLKTGLPLSVNYERYWTSRFVKSDLDRMNASVGVAINSFLSFGLTIHRETLNKKDKEVFWNGDVGALLRLGRGTGLGLTINQLLINERSNSRIATVGFYQKLLKTFNARADVSYSQQDKWIARGAIETIFRKFISLRVGSSWDFQTQQILYGSGLSFYGPRLQLDYSLEKDKRIFQHALIFKLFI